jgi:TPR repeat protein
MGKLRFVATDSTGGNVMRDLFRLILAAVFLLSSSAASAADLEKGLAAYDEGNYAAALEECLPLAEAGDATAQFCVARMYANGFGVMMDDAAALKWYGLAAAAGHAESQFNLGVMHANGWGVPMNDAEAAGYYRQAAEQGFVQAMSSLAYVTYRGIGVSEDVAEGYMWYDVAAKLGDFAAGQKRDDLASKMSHDDLLGAQTLALEWLEGFEGKALHAGRMK